MFLAYQPFTVAGPGVFLQIKQGPGKVKRLQFWFQGSWTMGPDVWLVWDDVDVLEI